MSDNSLPATKRKIDRAQRQGMVARAPELVAEATLLWGLFSVSFLAANPGALLRWFSATFRACLAAAAAPDPAAAADRALVAGLAPGLALLAVMAAGSLLLTLALHQAVAGSLALSWEALGPRFERLNPAAGLGRIFSGGAWGTALLSLLKLGLALGALALVFPRVALDLASLGAQSPASMLSQTLKRLLSLGFTLAGLLGVFAVVQAFWARKRWTDDLKMSRQEAVEDTKEAEGNPQTRRRFRVAHRRIARRRTLQAVAASDVVLANPTHVAVALRYRRGSMRAPRLMAKGADLMAQRIKDAARKLGIPVLEQPPLARDLYASVNVGREIPARLYRAVARIIHQLRTLPVAPKRRPTPR